MVKKKVLEQVQSLLRPKKIGVCTAWGSPFVWSSGAYNMMNLQHPAGVEVKFFPGRGRDPGRRHMWGVNKSLKWGATHICFLGADQLHDLDILVKFTDHCADGWAAVTALVPVRGWVPGLDKPFAKIAWRWKEGVDKLQAKLSLEFLESVSSLGPDCEEIAVIGSGAFMFDVNCLDSMKKPWFIEAPPDEDGRRLSMMDTMFCFRLVREADIKLLLDRTIQVHHIDAFAIDESYGDRFYDFPKEQDEAQRCHDRHLQQSGPLKE